MLIGGSPCTGFSITGKRLNFQDPQSKLFFDYIRLKELLKPKYFLLENIKMKKVHQDVITDYLKVEPVKINSDLLSCQNRERLYWTNINNGNIPQPQDKGILLKDIVCHPTYKIYKNPRIAVTKRITKGKIGYVQWDISGKNWGSIQDRGHFLDKKISTLTIKTPMKIVVDYDQDIYRC